MLIDDFFDIIVIGPHMGGLFAAALLAKRGKRVLLLGVPDRNENGNLESDPNDRVFTPLAGEWFLNKALSELAALPGRTRMVKSLSPSFQIVMPGRRVDVNSGMADPLGHLADEFNEDPKKVKRLFKELNNIEEALRNYFLSRFSDRSQGLKGLANKYFHSLSSLPVIKRSSRERFLDFLDEYQFGRPFRTALLAQIMAFSRLYSSNPTLTSAAQCLSVIQEGGKILSFERPSLASMLKSFILDRGGILIPEASIRKIYKVSNHVIALYLENQYKPYRCHHLLVNTNMSCFHEMLPEDMRDHKYLKRIQGIQASGFHFRMHFHINRKVIPVGMGENVLFVADSEEPLAGDNFLSMVAGPHDDPFADPKDHRILTVTCRLPLTQNHVNEQWIAGLKKQIIDRLNSLIPFFDQNLLHISHSVLPSMISSEAGMYPGCSLLYESDFAPFMGLSLLPSATPYGNIFLVGDEVLPGMGSNGMVLSACIVADMISGRVERFRF